MRCACHVHVQCHIYTFICACTKLVLARTVLLQCMDVHVRVLCRCSFLPTLRGVWWRWCGRTRTGRTSTEWATRERYLVLKHWSEAEVSPSFLRSSLHPPLKLVSPPPMHPLLSSPLSPLYSSFPPCSSMFMYLSVSMHLSMSILSQCHDLPPLLMVHRWT